MFTQAKQNRVFENVIAQIQEAIMRGDLREGDRLPPERDLKEQFRTSRGTLREALRVLEQKGLVEIKTGVNGGAFVKGLGSHQVTESFDLLLRSQTVSLKELAQFREEVEGFVTALAAQSAIEEDIDRLNAIVGQAGANLEKETPCWDSFIDIDNKFHRELARIGGNHLFILVLNSVHDNINRYYNRFLAKEKNIIAESYQDMRGILSMVKTGDAAQARFLAQEHVRRFTRCMELYAIENGVVHDQAVPDRAAREDLSLPVR